jgi:transposase InsO family protein
MTMDLLDCKTVTKRGNRYIAAFIESLSGFCFLSALEDKTAEGVAECLQKVIFEVGAVEEIGSDNGGEFVNEIVEHLCTAFGIKKTLSSSYHPQANGQVEHLNTRILQAAHAFSQQQQTEWDKHLPALQFALRTTPKTHTGITPFFAIYCREAMLPYDIMMNSPHERSLDLHED